MYKERCERLMRELQMTKKQMQQQHEEDLEQELQSRKLLEKRVRSVQRLSAFGSLHLSSASSLISCAVCPVTVSV